MANAGRLRGRGDEIRSLTSVLERAARSGQGALLAIAGEPGIGKTALVGEVVRRARELGFAVGVGRAEPLEQIAPMAPLLVALRSGTSPLLSAEQFSELGGVYGQPLWLVDRLTGYLEELAGRAPVLVVIDDLQWADRLTVFALRLMPGRLAGSPLVWLVATRPVPGGSAEEILDAAGDDVAQKTFALGPLEPRVIENLARDRLGVPLSGRLKLLLAGANGNPFLALELIDSMAIAKRLPAADGGTVGDEHAVGELPSDFVAGVHARLGSLPAGALRFLQVGSALGSSFTPAAAAALLGAPDTEAVLPWLEAAVKADVLVDDGERLTFRHDLLRQSVYENIAPSVRKALHCRAAEYLLAEGRSPVDAASHVLLGATPGDRAAVETLRQAASIVSRVMPSVAAEVIERAFELVPRDDPLWLEVGAETITILSRARHASSAVAVSDTLLATPLSAKDRARVQILVSGPLWDLGRLGEIRRRVEAELVPEWAPGPMRARLGSLRALSLSQGTDLAEANAAAESALAEGSRLGDIEAQVFASRALGEVARNDARHGRALHFFRQLNALTDGAHIVDEIMSLQLIDQYERSQEILTQTRLRVEDHGDAASLTGLAFAQMWHDYSLGLLEDAQAGALTLLRLCDDLHEHTYRVEARLILIRVAQLRGDLQEARRQLGDAQDRLGSDDGAHALIVQFTQAWIADSAGDLVSAVGWVGRVLRPARHVIIRLRWHTAWLMGAARIAVAAGQFDLAGEAASMAADLAEKNPGVATAAGVAAYTRGLASGDIALLADAADELRDAPRPLLRADAAGEYGAALLNGGDREAGVAWLDRAWDGFTDMGAHGEARRVQRVLQAVGVRRPWAATARRPTQGWDSLTPMERKVAIQVARGESNRAVADALYLSPYTVATHLRTAFPKLGVKSRVQLTRVVLDHLGHLDTE